MKRKIFAAAITLLLLTGCTGPAQTPQQPEKDGASPSSSDSRAKGWRQEPLVIEALQDWEDSFQPIYHLQFLSDNSFLVEIGPGDQIRSGVYELDTGSFSLEALPLEQKQKKENGQPYTTIDWQANSVLYYGAGGDLLRKTELPFAVEESLHSEKGHMYYPTAVSLSQKKALFLQESEPLSPLVFTVVDAEDGTLTEITADISGIFQTEELAAMLPDQELLKDIRFHSVRFLHDGIAAFEIWLCKGG